MGQWECLAKGPAVKRAGNDSFLGLAGVGVTDGEDLSAPLPPFPLQERPSNPWGRSSRNDAKAKKQAHSRVRTGPGPGPLCAALFHFTWDTSPLLSSKAAGWLGLYIILDTPPFPSYICIHARRRLLIDQETSSRFYIYTYVFKTM